MADYTIAWAREFRYDGARARYMNRPLDVTSLWQTQPSGDPDQTTVWTDYDGDETYGDFVFSGSTLLEWNSYEPGQWHRLKNGAVYVSSYLHNDHLGTLRRFSTAAGAAGASRVFTAFGEPKITSGTDRFGYVGAFGYQQHAEFPFLHVGHRYYDPTSGRFLQRDPIGLAGGPNVYTYTFNIPTISIDVDGFAPNNPGGAAGNTPAGAKQVVEIVKDMGKLAGDGKKVKYTKHAINQAISREGKGVATQAILNALKSGWVRQADGTLRFVGKYATLIMREDGTIITLWATCGQGTRSP